MPMKKCPSNELSKSSRHGSEPATERIHRKVRRKSAVDSWRREQCLKRTPFEGRMKMRKKVKLNRPRPVNSYAKRSTTLAKASMVRESAKQAIAIGLSKARRAGVDLPAPSARTSAVSRRKARLDSRRGKHPHKTSRKRSRAVEGALQKEDHASGSPRALSRHARSSARSRTRKERSVAAKKGAKTRASRARRTQVGQGGAQKPRLWVRKVSTESTCPPEGVFKKDAKTIASVMATRKTSPKELAQRSE